MDAPPEPPAAPAADMTVSVGDLFVAPKAVLFENVEPEPLYVCQLTIRNTGKTMTRLRITPPKSPFFTLSYVPTGSVAAGLSITADIEFQMRADGPTVTADVLDAITVTNGRDVIEVPLRANLPAPRVTFDPVLDFGLVVHNTQQSAPLQLSNQGSRPAKWSLVLEDGAPVACEPPSGVLAPSLEALEKAGGLPAHLQEAQAALDAMSAGLSGNGSQLGSPPPPGTQAASSGGGDGGASVASQEVPSATRAELAQFMGPTSANLMLTFKAGDGEGGGGGMGPFRSVARLQVEGQLPQIVDLSAIVVEQHLTVVYRNSKRPVKSIDFGNTLYGETAVVEALLVNDGPNPVPYFIASEVDRMMSEQISRQIQEDLQNDKGPNDSSTADLDAGMGAGLGTSSQDSTQGFDGSAVLESVSVSPGEGTVPPYSTRPLTFTFSPQPPAVRRGFAKAVAAAGALPTPYCLTTTVESGETKQTVQLSVVGRASQASIEVTQVTPEGKKQPVEMLRFGECPVHERRDMLVSIRNISMAPVPYRFPKTANFGARPDRGLLQPMQEISTVVTFRPVQLGKFKKRVNLVIEGGAEVTKVPIWCQGHASTVSDSKPPLKGGIDKLPEDFRPDYHFLPAGLPEKESGAEKKAKWQREKPWEAVDLINSTSWDEEVKQPISTAHLTYSVQDLERRALHRETYMDWLKNARLDREGKGKMKAQSKKSLLANPQYKKLYSKFDARGIPTHDAEGNPLPGEEIDRLREGNDMGMVRGLSEPIPPLPEATESLWLLRAKDGGAGGAARRMPADETKLIAKKFKETPSTQAEVRDCAAELSMADQHKVVVSHKVLDFGQVCVSSVSARSLSFSNDLTRAVQVSLGKLEPELGRSQPSAQVVPAGSLAGFDIYFTSPNVQMYKRTLTYAINDRHVHKLTVMAQVVPVEVILSPTEIDMAFAEHDLESSTTRKVRLENPGNSVAEFFWAGRGPFTVTPEQGSLPAGQSTEVTVTWKPNAKESNTQSLALHVPGGEDQNLTVRGDLPETKCAFTTKKLELGTMAVGIPGTKTVNLKNTGKNPATVFIESFDSSTGIVVEPDRARVDVGETVQLSCTITPTAPRSYQGLSIQANVRGSKLLKLPLIAEAVVPELEVAAPFDKEPLDFQDVTIGGSERKVITLVNKGPIAASLLLDLTPYGDFFVSRAPLPLQGGGDGDEEEGGPETNDEEGPGGKPPSTAGGKSEKGSLPGTPKPPGSAAGSNKPGTAASGRLGTAKTNMSGMGGGSQRGGGSKGGSYAGDDGEGEAEDPTDIAPLNPRLTMKDARSFAITIGPAGTLSLNIDFVPTAPVPHDFVFPLKLKGVPQAPPQLARPVNAVGLRPRLIMSKSIVDFEDRVVPRDASRRVPFSSELTFTNSHTMGITWNLNDDILKEVTGGVSEDGMPVSPIFFVSPKTGDLAPGETVTLRVTFSPQDNHDYEAVVPLYLEDQPDMSRPYLNLTLRGSGVFPRLDFSTKEVVLQTVPLGITSRGVLEVYNNGYDDLELSHRLPVHTPVKIGVEYPEGTRLGLTMQKLTVVLSFMAEAAVSFHTNVELVDSEGNTYTIAVVGATDNSVLTSFSFLQHYADNYGYYAHDGKPVQFMGKQRIAAFERHELREKEKARRARAAQRAIEGGKKAPPPPPPGQQREPSLEEELAKVTDEGVDMGASPNVVDHRVPDFLREWLNANVMAHPMETFPQDFIRTNGRLAIDAIDTMCGKKCPGRLPKGGKTQSKTEGWRELVGQYNAVLLFLKERGALLNNVLPKNLLSQEDFVRAQEAEIAASGVRLTAAQMRNKRATWEETYSEESAAAWTTLMLQAVRTFVLARITPKAFASLPGMLVSMGRGSGKDGKGPSVDPELVKSNVYTTSEALLLKWAAYHVNATTPASALPKRITDFDSSWCDGSILCHLFHSHVESLNEGLLQGYTQVTNITDLKDKTVQDANLARAMAAADKLQVGLALTDEHTTDPHPAVMLLYALHLYMFLPQMIPKTTVDFNATLGSTTQKNIELRNPAKVPIRYRAVLEGSGDFSIPKDEVVIPAKSAANFVVALDPRFSEPVEARLTLLAERSGPVQASHMVFVVRSQVDSRLPVSAQELSGECYQKSEIDFEVKNPFNVATTFEVKLEQECVESVAPQQSAGAVASAAAGKPKGAKKGGRGSKEALDRRTDEEKDMEELLNKPFWTRSTQVFLEPGATSKVSLMCVPFMPGVYRCEIILLSKDAGELSYECVATIGLPQPTDKMTMEVMSLDDGSTIQRLLRIPQKNEAQEKAFAMILERVPNAQRTKCRLALQALSRPASLDGSNVSYSVEVDSPYYTVRDTCDMISDAPPAGGGGDGGGRGGTGASTRRPKSTAGGSKKVALEDIDQDTDLDQPNSLVLNFYPRTAGQYPCRVLISGMGSTTMDIRAFSLEAIVSTPPVETSLDFKAPARQKIAQSIPIVNNGHEEWQLSCAVTGSRLFSGPNSLKVPPNGEPAAYELTFQPEWITDEAEVAVLTLKNPKTGTEFKYDLTGQGEEPLAEDHLIRRCNAREAVELVFAVPHFLPGAKGKPLEAAVESDMPFVSGAESITVPSGGTEYTLKMSPQIGGTYTGSITFKAETGEYLWYTMEVVVDSPLESKSIDLQATVRQVVSMEISLVNPLPEPITFDVVLQGDGILGDSSFTLGPSETGAYELFYSPLVAKVHEGSLAFLNESVGEFWYKLNLTADTPAPVTLEPLAAPVGAKTRVALEIENPLGKDIAVSSRVSNTTNFVVEPAVIQIGPYATTTVHLEYVPSSLNDAEATEVSLTHPELGSWEYLAEGRGELPGVMPEHRPEATIDEPTSYMFSFRNPFKHRLSVDIVLRSDSDLTEAGRSEDDPPTFRLLMNKASGVLLEPFAQVQVPVSFSPSTITEKRGTVEVRAAAQGHQLLWVFPLVGLVNAPQHPRSFQLKTKAKTSLREVIDLPLRSLADVSGPESFSYELQVPESMEKIVADALTLNPVQTTISDPDDPIRYQVTFEPMRPFSTSLLLVVVRSSGGRWPFEIQLDASDADVDDNIAIEAALKTTSVVTFRLVNRIPAYSPFQAFFSTDSALSFSVSPSSGLLGPPESSDGAAFSVSFSPVEYGRRERGRLIIQTEETTWSYEVTGTNPSHKLPTDIKSMVDTKLDPEVERALLTKPRGNAMARNMRVGREKKK